AVVAEEELPVLVIRASAARLHVDFVIVIFAVIFKERAEFESVARLDPRETVRQVVNRASGVRRIWATAESRKCTHIHGWNAVLNFLPSRVYIGIVHAKIARALRHALRAVQEMRFVHRNVNDILAIAEQDLIHFGWADNPCMVY